MASKLPVELVCKVANAADPSVHFNLALACRYFHACLQGFLSHHKDCHARYRAASDILPGTIPLLFRDPIARYHVRALEFWCTRRTWDDWNVYHLYAEFRLKAQADHPPPRRPYDRFFFSEQEKDDLRDSFHDMLPRENEFSLYFAHESSGIEDGSDIKLKIILTCLCPRLKALRIVSSNQHFLEGLSFLITDIANANAEPTKPGGFWPEGLNSVETIAVGVPCASERLRASRPHTNAHGKLSLFRLPNLHSLYLNELNDDDFDNANEDFDEETNDSGYDSRFRLPPGCSNLRHLFLDDFASHLPMLTAMLKAASSLKRMAFSNSSIDNFDFDQLFTPASHLDSLAVWSTDVHGYRSNMCYPDEGLGPCCMVAMSDCMLCSHYDDAEDKRETLTEYFSSFAGRTGTLVFLEGGCFFPSSEDSYEEDIDFIDQALATLIKRGELDELKALSLQDLERRTKTDRIRFYRTIRAGKKAGIKVYTRTTPVAAHPDEGLLEGATEKDLETSPLRQSPRVQDIVLIPHLGMRHKGCDHCGACGDCYSWYSKELWDNRHAVMEEDSEGDDSEEEEEEEDGDDIKQEDDEGEREDQMNEEEE
ncbi:hypothetical protein F4778DRAFT_73346 [Xylariomycetidae sp. FL2044]|nr:hypothetical protein F4778DRAFT_73346 [Xylariomycetidae sp. FL2044]